MIVYLRRLFSSVSSGKIGVIEISTGAVKYLGGEKLSSKFNFDHYLYESIFTNSGRLGLHNGRLSLKFLDDVILPAIFFSIKELIKFGVKRENISIVSTALLREAKNADECVKVIEKATDLPVRIIPGEEEAVGAISAFLKVTKRNLKDKYVVGVDIGGGSTEIAVILNNKTLFKRSFKVGMILGYREQITIPTNIFKDKNKDVVIVGNGYCLKKAAGILDNTKFHDSIIPVSGLKELSDNGLNPPPVEIATKVYLELANILNCDYIIGNGTGNIYAELLDKKIN
jgi:hypothetical protein